MRKILGITAFLALMTGVSVASAEDELTSLSYISYLERYATVEPASQDESIEAVINLPLVSGDRIDTAREARLEVVLADGNVLWLDEYTSVSLDAVAFSRDTGGDRTVLFLAEGAMMIEVFEFDGPSRPVRIDGRSDNLYLNQPGLYRVETTRTGGLRLEVWTGLAEVATSGGGILVRSEYAAELKDGILSGIERYRTEFDDFAQWVEQRRQVVEGESAQFVDLGYSRQASQLDNYGDWVYVEGDNVWAWQPAVSSTWRPYTAGRWYWTNVGWNWVSYEPWGWMPYHYGSWYHHAGYGWLWSWNRYWSPSWVNWLYYPGYIGWCPAGYHSYWWWSNYGGHHDYWGGGYGRGSHGGHGGNPVPPRRDVVPRRTTSTLTKPRRVEVPQRSDVVLALDGRVRVGDIDRTGWNVVSVDDFASPRLARTVKPGEVALRGITGVEGFVRSGALMTTSPSVARTGPEIERAFVQGSSGSSTDLTRILAHDSNVRAVDAVRLARPVTASSFSQTRVGFSRGLPERAATPSEGTEVTRSSATRTAPNLHRPVLTSEGSFGSRSSATSGSTTLATGRQLYVPSGAGTTSGSSRAGGDSGVSERTVEVRPGSSSTGAAPRASRGPSSSPPIRSSTWRSTTGSSISRQPIRSSTSTRSSSSGSRSSGPVIVPRTSSSTRSSRGGSSSGKTATSTPRSTSRSVSPSGTSSSSTRSSSSSRSSSSGSSARNSSSSRSSSSRSSASSSRSSSSSSRSSSSSSRSSSSSSSSSRRK